MGPDGAGRIGLVEGDGMADSRGVDPCQITAPAHRPDDRCAALVRKLGGQGPDPAQHPLHQDGQAGDRAVGEHRPVAVIPGMPRQAPTSSATPSGRSIAWWEGTTVSWAAVPKGR